MCVCVCVRYICTAVLYCTELYVDVCVCVCMILAISVVVAGLLCT